MINDSELLRQYTKAGSETAFTELVSRHLPLVYSAALRQMGGNHELAKDVAQNVFIDLARKAGSLAGHEVLTAWLYTSTRFAAGTARRSEQRRKAREQKAAAMQALHMDQSSDSDWERIFPVLDDLMHELSAADRLAVLLRFFEDKNLKEVGLALGVSDDAARMRVTRAVDKLHSLLTARRVTLSCAALGSLLACHAVQAAPAGLAATIAGKSLSAAGAGATAFHLLLHALRAEWKLLTLPGVALVVALAVGIYIKASPSESAAPRADQANAPATAPDEFVPVPEESTEPANALTGSSGPAAGQMQFQLLDAESGDPITGAKLRATYFGEGGRMKGARLATDAQGKATVELSQARYGLGNLFVTADGHVPKVVSWYSADRPKEYKMKLERGSIAGGIVVDESQKPVALATIKFNGPGTDLAQPENIGFGPDTEVSTDANGRWFCNMIPKAYEAMQVILTHPNFAPTPARIVVNTEQSENLVLQIRSGITLNGLVRDTNGRPVPDASVRQVHNRQESQASSKTDASGRFELKHLRAEEVMIVVQAKGLAPEVVETNLSANPTELVFVLKPGNVLRGRVVDDQGIPITNAVAQTDWDNEGLRKIEWSVRTDNEGRFEWISTPSEPLLYWFEAEGFQWSRNLLLKADGSEHEIKLARHGGSAAPAAIQVSGTVTDAESGLPLDQFKVLFGEVRSLPAEPEFRFIANGQDGAFKFALKPPFCSAMYQVLVEKEGYTPIASTNLLLKSGNQVLDLRIRRGSGPGGIVLLPGGEPAFGATVFLYETKGGVYMDKPGAFRKDLGLNTPARVLTDETGRFSFPPKLQAMGLIAIHEEGYAELPLQAFSETIMLQPWGRVEGRLVIAGQPGANETITLANVLYRYGENGRHFPPLLLWLEAKTDAEGNFVFEKVPPGERRICRRLAKPGSQVGRICETHGLPINVAAGAVTSVEVGGTGTPIVGKLASSPESTAPDWRTVSVELRLKLPGAPGTRPVREQYATTEAFIQATKSFAEADRRFWTSDEGRGLERAQRSYVAFCREDGSFLLPDVPPGTYELKIETAQARKNSVSPSRGPVGDTSVVLLAKQVVVPEAVSGPEAAPVDLGLLEVKPTPGVGP